jgi:soluble cytochrome b562
MSDMEIEGFDDLLELIDQLGKVPQKVATKAARQGAQIDLTATKADAPVYDGWLKASLKLVGEKAKNPGKKVYEITFDRAYNSKLVKTSKSGNRSYYPVSQEFGWKYPNGGYHVGLQYMKNTAEENESTVEQKIVDVAKNEIDKILSQAR